MLPAYVAIEYPGAGCPNGLNAVTAVLPLIVIAKLFALASRKRLLWQVSTEVPLIAVNGAVGGVKLLV
jgi:hypothetical protein